MPEQIPYTGTFKTLQEIVDLLNSMTTPTNIPAPPTEDGSYNLACTVTDGEVVYSWVSVE